MKSKKKKEYKNVRIKRKQFIKLLFTFLLIPFAYLWKSVSDKKIKESSQNEKIIKINDLPFGINFLDQVIVYKTENNLEIYSSKCTHLGCKINSVANDEIVCPCHGSRYSLNGDVIKGPSTKPLVKLSYKLDQKNESIIIQI